MSHLQTVDHPILTLVVLELQVHNYPARGHSNNVKKIHDLDTLNMHSTKIQEMQHIVD